MPLTVYRSSAGSGKTYILAREYVRLAISSPEYYQKILAVTFTNRAAEEMKERVLKFLIDISRNQHELIDYYAKELDKSRNQIVKSARDCLSHILHHYGQFNITTIDTFFHRVIRSFSREIGLHGNFGIELDTDKVAEYITSSVYQGVENDPQLKNWLVEFSMDGLLKGEGYETKKNVLTLARQLFKEEFKRLPVGQFTSKEAKSKLGQLKTQLAAIKKEFEEYLAKISQKFKDELAKSGLESSNIKNGNTIFNFFKKIEKIEKVKVDELIGSQLKAALDDPINWIKKSEKDKSNHPRILSYAQEIFIPLILEAYEYINEHKVEYFTAKTSLKHLYTIGLMSDLAGKLDQYKEDEETIMISDLADFLTKIIDDTGSPFIYDKVGTWYSHFLIDEFQDTSYFQYNNFRPLLEESIGNGNANVIVGDAKQSIYGWRGGDPSILISQIQKDFKSVQIDPTKNTNWRSSRNIVQFNNELFSKLPGILCDEMGDIISAEDAENIQDTYSGVEQNISSDKQSEEGLVHLEFLDSGELAWKQFATEKTIEKIEELLREGHQLNDMAILVRTNKEATDIVNYVLDYKKAKQSKVEVISADGMLLENSSIVQLFLSAFKHLMSPDDVSLKADLTYRYQKHIKGKEFESHEDFLKIINTGLPASFTKFKQHLLHLPIFELVEVLIRTFQLNTIKDEIVYLQAFQDAVLEFTKSYRSDIRLFLDWWEDHGKSRSVQLTGSLNAVEVITSHKSKGLQYPIVFVPFCNFDMNSRAKPVWYDSPYSKDEFLAVEYKSELADTKFEEQYRREFAKWHLESLNVLYVALTRAENGLFIYCEPTKPTATMFANVSKLLWKFFETNTLDGWDRESKVYSRGTLHVSHSEDISRIINLNKYTSNKWSHRLRVTTIGRAYFDDDVEKKRNEGVLLHQILSEIIHYKDTEKILSGYLLEAKITREDHSRYFKLFEGFWKDDLIKSWFDGTGEIKTEVVVLPKDGEIKRMDRVVIKKNEAVVIDFKNGNAKSADRKQVLEYVELLRQMGYKAKGYLLYLKSARYELVD